MSGDCAVSGLYQRMSDLWLVQITSNWLIDIGVATALCRALQHWHEGAAALAGSCCSIEIVMLYTYSAYAHSLVMHRNNFF